MEICSLVSNIKYSDRQTHYHCAVYQRQRLLTVRTSETSVDNHFTRQYNPEDSSEHHTRRRENLKSHILTELLFAGKVTSLPTSSSDRILYFGCCISPSVCLR
jgi:hypothetical protein